jgi:hypothetical protein
MVLLVRAALQLMHYCSTRTRALLTAEYGQVEAAVKLLHLGAEVSLVDSYVTDP